MSDDSNNETLENLLKIQNVLINKLEGEITKNGLFIILLTILYIVVVHINSGGWLYTAVFVVLNLVASKVIEFLYKFLFKDPSIGMGAAVTQGPEFLKEHPEHDLSEVFVGTFSIYADRNMLEIRIMQYVFIIGTLILLCLDNGIGRLPMVILGVLLAVTMRVEEHIYHVMLALEVANSLEFHKINEDIEGD